MLKPILYMATSANGRINDAVGQTPWCTSEWKKYKQTLDESGCLIVGRKTHEAMLAHEDYDRLNIRRVVVLTQSEPHLPANMKAAKTPKEALALLEAEGFSAAIIGGGAEANAAFLRTGLVQEVYLDVEPFLFGDGLPLFSAVKDLNFFLRLEAVDRYTRNAVGLRYTLLTEPEEE